MPFRKGAVKRRFRRRIPRYVAWQSTNTVGSLVVAPSATVSTSKAFTYAQVFSGTFTTSQLPVQIKKVSLEFNTSLSAGVVGSASVFAELVGQPFTAGAGASLEGACASPARTVGIGGKCFLVLKPTLPANRNWIDPTSTTTFFSISALSTSGTQLQYAIRVHYTIGRQAGYNVV